MKIRLIAAVFVFASVLAAHHSVPAEYDISKTITIRGSVTKIEWTNPHARFWVDAKNDDGVTADQIAQEKGHADLAERLRAA